MTTPAEFTCPVCGSHCFGSSENGDGTRTYNCQEGPNGPCLFSVHEKYAAKCGIKTAAYYRAHDPRPPRHRHRPLHRVRGA